MLFYVLQHHLFLLQGLKAALAHVSGLFAEPPVGGGGEVPSPPLSFAPGFDQSGFRQAAQHAPRISFGLLDQPRGFVRRESTFLPQGIEHEQLVQAQDAAGFALLSHQADKVEVCFAAGRTSTTPASLLRA